MYQLAQVEQIKKGEGTKVGEITVVIDSQVISHLGGDIIIDHNNMYGFILKNEYEVLTFGMKWIKSF
ncbi:hypothetical protein [Bacillus sp. AFS040349]|uniref:hypothetical protein n=1 Tax=Bacillus sp. AFS040349 TaxID=2033502 RepID=UPI000BFC3EC2|nr:hypothetical protein [Bacillus sp. AFS040349]PGT77934.1 hypothetical protein COD11_24285 [Bacillus sp. AFS040349]